MLDHEYYACLVQRSVFINSIKTINTAELNYDNIFRGGVGAVPNATKRFRQIELEMN